MTTDHVWKMLLLDEHKNYSIDNWFCRTSLVASLKPTDNLNWNLIMYAVACGVVRVIRFQVILNFYDFYAHIYVYDDPPFLQ